MTDKTIINGVDVSGCEMRDLTYGQQCKMPNADNSGFHQGLCLQNPNCYFKQTARKDERIRELEDMLNDVNVKRALNSIRTGDYDLWKGCYKELYEKREKLSQIVELTNQIIESNDKPACVHDKECPLNGGDGFDNHCNMTCPFIIAQQIKQIAQGE